MLIGYARAPIAAQKDDVDAMTSELRALGCDVTFIEQVNSNDKRSVLKTCIDCSTEEDVLVVTKLERLANSVADFCQIQQKLKEKNITLRVDELEYDSSTEQGEVMLRVFESVAKFEQDVTRSRQRDGIEKAKAEGKYKGRKPVCEEAKKLVEAMIINGKKPQEIMQKIEIGKTTFYKIKKELAESENTLRA